MTTDFRALCARMADELDYYRQLLMDDRREIHALANEARAALAEPESNGRINKPVVPSHYCGDAIRVYREGFHAGHRYAFTCISASPRIAYTANQLEKPIEHSISAMAELSPAAKTVLDAFKEQVELTWLTKDPDQVGLAAALRAAVDEYHKDPCGESMSFYLFMIATELEGQ